MNLNLSIKSIRAITNGQFIYTAELGKSSLIKNVVIDSRSPIISDQSLFILFEGNKLNGADFVTDFQNKGGKLILTDHFISNSAVSQIVVDDTLRALQSIAKHHREQFAIPVIGITGSNGKTTVKEWLYSVLKDHFVIVRSPKSYNSQIGVALSVLELNSNHTLAIFEAGISQVGEMDYLQAMIQPTIGVFTGIGDAHNAGFSAADPIKQKLAEKFLLFKQVNDLFEWYEDRIKIYHKGREVNDLPYTQTEGGFALKTQEDLYKTTYFDTASKANIALVAAVAGSFGLTQNEIQSKINELPIISMRLEKIEGKEQNILISDVYNLDEKSLEIGLHYLQTTAKTKDKYVFLAEDASTTTLKNTLLPALERMMEQLEPIQLIYFGSSEVAKEFPFIKRFFDKAIDYLDAPLSIRDSVILFTGSRKSHLEVLVNAFTEKKHITRLVADLSKMRNNLNFFRAHLKPETMILAMVKAQSYGGGIVEVASFLEREKVSYFGVAYADEGVTLRKAGIKTKILVMNPEPAAFDDLIDYELEPSIYSYELLENFIRQLIIRQKSNFPIHLKIDTGMNRLGFRQDELADALGSINAQPEVYVRSVFSHLAVADSPSENAFTRKQQENFEKACQRIEEGIGYAFTKHLANSAGAYFHPSAQYDMVRIGIGLYGLLTEALSNELENVLELRSEISQIRTIAAGETVGYARDFVASSSTRIGIVPVGYADGIRRGLGHGKWSVIINQKKYPIIGRICMDMCMIDLGDDSISAGTEVQLFGVGNSVFKMSKLLQTIPYEIISSISARVKRVYLEG